MTGHAVIVVGLCFGDEGKGSVVDYLVRKNSATTVVRFNGGPQAAHHVVTTDGHTHCFSQFGSGTLVPGVRTILSRFMVFDPLALLKEAAALAALGITDSLARIVIDGDCVLVTPYHALINQALEISRGDTRHGSCGRGVGQAQLESESWGERAIRAKDLLEESTLHSKIRFLRLAKLDIAEQLLRATDGHPQISEIVGHLRSLEVETMINERYRDFTVKCRGSILDGKRIGKMLGQSVVFEGAQGVLLDREFGFFPYVTPSITRPLNARLLLEEWNWTGTVTTIGVIRAYATRHGAGPFVTEDGELAARLPEQHNGHHPWQGAFRVGWPDFVALKYACAVAGTIDGLAVTNIDRIERLDTIRICRAYLASSENSPFENSASRGDSIRPRVNEGSRELADSLYRARPELTSIRASDLLTILTDELSIPIVLTSRGPTAREKQM